MMQIENRAFTLDELKIISAANEEMEAFESQLVDLIYQWQNEANGKYCQTYNKGMAQGLREAADSLEALLDKRQEGANDDNS